MLKQAVPVLALFTSFGTLVCCALPALFVSLGMGAALVGVLSAAPQLIWLSEHKGAVFGAAGALIVLNAILRRRNPPTCPSDPRLAAQCARLQKLSAVIFYVSIAFYAVGAFFAFLAPRLFA